MRITVILDDISTNEKAALEDIDWRLKKTNDRLKYFIEDEISKLMKGITGFTPESVNIIESD